MGSDRVIKNVCDSCGAVGYMRPLASFSPGWAIGDVSWSDDEWTHSPRSWALCPECSPKVKELLQLKDGGE